MPELAIDRVVKLLGVAGSSSHDGEALNALRMTDRLLRAANMTWPDLVKPSHQLEVAVEAARVLLAENNELKDEIERLRAFHRTTTIPVQITNLQASNASEAARWALELHRAGAIWLTTFEVDFLGTCSRWLGRLTKNQQPVFQRIMNRITEYTGLQPP